VFSANGTTYGTLEGEDAPVPAVSTLRSDARHVRPADLLRLPVQVAIDPDVGLDPEVLLELNVHESFRWQDQSAPRYTSKVFDTTPNTFEPVMAFGANAFTLTIASAQKR